MNDEKVSWKVTYYPQQYKNYIMLLLPKARHKSPTEMIPLSYINNAFIYDKRKCTFSLRSGETEATGFPKGLQDKQVVSG